MTLLVSLSIILLILPSFQDKIRNRLLKPLNLPYYLNSYPFDFFEYLPRFTGEDHVTAEKHLGAFEYFVDNFEILHEDVVMRLFLKSLVGDAAFWFRNLEAHSICSWTEFYNSFSRYWGENKSFNQYLFEFSFFKKKRNETIIEFNRIFHNIYYSMPIEI